MLHQSENDIIKIQRLSKFTAKKTLYSPTHNNPNKSLLSCKPKSKNII